MKLSSKRFTCILALQLSFLFLDLILNTISLFPRSRETFVILFIIQDLILVMAIAAMLMTFFSTYLFQAGLIELLFDKFKPLIGVSVSYLLISIATHSIWLFDKWNNIEKESSIFLIFMFTIHRVLSGWYYFFYKRAALRISDPRFYEDIDWMNQQIDNN